MLCFAFGKPSWCHFCNNVSKKGWAAMCCLSRKHSHSNLTYVLDLIGFTGTDRHWVKYIVCMSAACQLIPTFPLNKAVKRFSVSSWQQINHQPTFTLSPPLSPGNEWNFNVCVESFKYRSQRSITTYGLPVSLYFIQFICISHWRFISGIWNRKV